MSHLKSIALKNVGNNFVDKESNSDENNKLRIRLDQTKDLKKYRQLDVYEIQRLEALGNYCPNWADVWVSQTFNPEQIRKSSFFGYVRIGAISDIALSYRDLTLATGIYNSQIVNCDIGDNCALHNVRYIAHYILGHHVMLSSIDEMVTSDVAKFGNGILKEGEQESTRIQLEVCNENGGRSIYPFDGMQSGDAYLWSRHRDDELLQQRFRALTDQLVSKERGFYSEIGNYTVLKNSRTIKDVKIGEHAYIKGVNKLKNLTINSSLEAYTQIGEGCELVNGIIGYGCRIFYGVKAVRFVLSAHSQLKYGARLINSFLGENSTISCCEVLNSLLFSAHEQHHNNSFLCASFLMGQSNMAAGATVGSNHNSRAADGELIAGRGFWPGLCVNLKHNSRFASYTLIAKGDFAYELDLKLPFSLLSIKAESNEVNILPGYWFLHNMYALQRNESKYIARNKTKSNNPLYEYQVLAPDTINEMIDALKPIERAVQAYCVPFEKAKALRKRMLKDKKSTLLKVKINGVENSKRDVYLTKACEGYRAYQTMIRYYIGKQLIDFLSKNSLDELIKQVLIPRDRSEFVNVGGQLMCLEDYQELIYDIKSIKLNSWDAIHKRYQEIGMLYSTRKWEHAIACLQVLSKNKDLSKPRLYEKWILDTLDTKEWIVNQIINSRSKDYQNPFRQSTYFSPQEMNKVIGALEQNEFIQEQQQNLTPYIDKAVEILLDKFQPNNRADKSDYKE